jgi:hypothetical protein
MRRTVQIRPTRQADKTTANKTIEGDYRVDNHGEGD